MMNAVKEVVNSQEESDRIFMEEKENEIQSSAEGGGMTTDDVDAVL